MEMKNSAKGVGIELLSRAGKAGHIKAQYLLVKHYFESKHFIDKKWLKQLKPARDADLGDAWMLSTDIYAKLQNFRYSCGKNVVKGYTKAAELGCYRAWDRLARLYYYGKCVPENKEKAEEYWKKFIKCDEKIRSQDLNDFYWPKIKMPVIVTYDKDGLPSPRVTTRQSLAEQKHYFSTY
jgi:TPR repeat protein